MKVKLTTYDSSNRAVTFALPAGETVIGRGDDCDIRLSDPEVSRRHCRLVLANGALKVIDLSSTNGTVVNGEPVQEGILSDGDRLTVGETNLTVKSTPNAKEATYSGVAVDMSRPESPHDSEMDSVGCRRGDTAAGVHVAGTGGGSSSRRASDGPGNQLARRQPVSPVFPIQPAGLGNVLYPSVSADKPDRSRGPLQQAMRYPRTIIAVMVLVTIPAMVAVWALSGPEYLAVGQVRVRPIIPHLVFKTEESGTIPFYQSYLNTQVGVMCSPTVLQRTLDQSDVQETVWYGKADPFWRPSRSKLERLREDLVVEPRGLTELIDVSMRTASGGDSAVIVNAILDQYIQYLSETSDEGTDMMFRQLAEECRALETELMGREEMVAKLRKQLGTGAPKELVSQRRVRLDQTQAKLNTVRRTLATARLRRSDLRERLDIKGDSPDKSAARDVRPRPQDDMEWNRLNLAVKQARHEVDLASQHFGHAHPKIISLKKQAAFAQELLTAREQQLAEGWRLYTPEQVVPVATPGTPAGLALQLEDTNWQIKMLTYEEGLLSEDLRKQKSAWENTFDRAQILDRELVAIRQKRQLYDAVRNRLEQKRMERNVPGSIEVLARAVVPSAPARDRRLVLTILSLLVGLGAGFGAAFLRTGVDSSIYQAEEFRQATMAPFLGQLPQVETKHDQQ